MIFYWRDQGIREQGFLIQSDMPDANGCNPDGMNLADRHSRPDISRIQSHHDMPARSDQFSCGQVSAVHHGLSRPVLAADLSDCSDWRHGTCLQQRITHPIYTKVRLGRSIFYKIRWHDVQLLTCNVNKAIFMVRVEVGAVRPWGSCHGRSYRAASASAAHQEEKNNAECTLCTHDLAS